MRKEKEPTTQLGKIARLYRDSFNSESFSPSTRITRNTYTSRFEELGEVIGLKKVTQKSLGKVIEELRNYPQYRSTALKGVPYNAVKRSPKYKPLTKGSLTTSISYLALMVEWAYYNGHLKEDFSVFVLKHKPAKNKALVSESRGSLILPTNPDEMIIKGGRSSNQFNTGELEAVFNTHIFVGTQRNRHIATTGYIPLHYWLYPIAYYTGMRSREIAQLAVGDVVSVSGVLGFAVNDSHHYQRVKNKESRRFVPIHSDLVKMGFIDFLDWRTNDRRTGASSPLFHTPITKAFTHSGNGMHVNISKLIRREAGLPFDKRYSTHGFRHLFIDTVRKLGVEEWRIAQVVGHDTISKGTDALTTTKYGHKSLSAKELQEVVETFSAPLDLPSMSDWGTFKDNLLLIRKR